MATPTRRSRRERKANTRYDDQIAWEEALPMLRAESDSPDRSSDSPTPEAFERTIDPDIEDVVMQDAEDLELELGREDGEFSDAAQSSSVGTPDEDGRDTYLSKLGSTPGGRHRKAVPRPRTKALAIEQGLRSRMLEDGDGPKLRYSKEKMWTYSFGSTMDDLYPVLRARDVWHLNPRDVILPSRTSIRQALRLDAAGNYLERGKRHEAENSEARPSEVANYQQTHPVDDEDATKQMFWDLSSSNEVVIGRQYKARKHKLELLRSLNIAEVSQQTDTISSSYQDGVFSVLSPPRKGRPRTKPRQKSVDNLDQDANSNEAGSSARDAYHEGWLINLGARPQCLAWAPVRTDGQYLAVSFKCSKAQREAAPPKPNKLASAFSPSPDYPSHIQIWRMMASPGEADAAARFSHDSSCAPHLLQRICMKIGNILSFEWLPLATGNTTASDRSMVILSSDGNIRIITIDLTAKGTFEITQPRLTARPPWQTVFTCFSLASHEDLVAGGADGAVRIFNLNDFSESGELPPYTTIQIHNTYIMNIAVATDVPQYLASTSASGELVLTDLRSPNQDRVRLHRSRLPTRNLSYVPHTRIFLSTSDASGNSERHGTSLSTVIGHSLRHFYHGTNLMKLPEASGITTVLASSPFHTIMLVANASGSVFASNILRRLIPTPIKQEFGGGFMIKLCEVEWLPMQEKEAGKDEKAVEADTNGEEGQTDAAGAESSEKPTHQFVPEPAMQQEPTVAKSKPDIDIFHGSDTRSGITRIHEHFKPEKIDLGTHHQDETGKKSRGKNKDQRRAENALSAASYQIICHEEQAVTAMAWNGNGRFSGWAAIAWGSGILRIQDLAHGI
ncbi:hypothetical protein OHC33_009183 [Knufia fluminis]|uniref:Uncharacterized protein n=1 Tax=Knufia fluminis TaxID=191047 RepID=A0AAN8E9K8_9EURO|nr:hypothetical protein OHC33_009183 [Knufia fluminis]